MYGLTGHHAHDNHVTRCALASSVSFRRGKHVRFPLSDLREVSFGFHQIIAVLQTEGVNQSSIQDFDDTLHTADVSHFSNRIIKYLCNEKVFDFWVKRNEKENRYFSHARNQRNCANIGDRPSQR
jgi:hypothetical protein